MKIAISDVIVPPDRFREHVEPLALAELISSMTSVGLIQPIVITDYEDDATKYTLLAGHRRVLAARSLGWKYIEAVLFEDLPILKKKIIEFDENHKRANFTWQEEAKAIAEIHALKQAEDPSWNFRKTGLELGISIGRVHEDVQLAQVILPTSPLGPQIAMKVAAHTTRMGALDSMKTEVEAALEAEMAKRTGQPVAPPTVSRQTLSVPENLVLKLAGVDPDKWSISSITHKAPDLIIAIYTK